MGAMTTLYGDLSPRTAAKAARGFIDAGKYILISERFADTEVMPAKSSKVLKFRRMENLVVPTAPLSEGQTPIGQKPTYTDVQVVLEQEGDFVEITDVIEDTHEDPVLQKMVELEGIQAAETLETRRISVLAGGTNILYAGNVALRTSVASVFTRGLLRQAVRTLRAGRAAYFTRILKATPDYATQPVGPCFWGLGHTDLASDIRGLPGFVPVEQYSNSDAAIEGEEGKCENIRFVLSNLPAWAGWPGGGAAVGTTGLISVGASLVDVYPLLIVAPHAYAAVAFKGRNAVVPTVLNPSTPSKSDPNAQRGYVAWKTWRGDVILNDAWMIRIETGCTDQPS